MTESQVDKGGNRMKKRIVAGMLFTAVFCSAFTGCGNNQAASGSEDEGMESVVPGSEPSTEVTALDNRENTDSGLSRGKQEEAQQQHNFFMATYVLPHIMEMRNPYYQELVRAIEKGWANAFKNSKIKAATFETVAGGFQRKFFGFSI